MRRSGLFFALMTTVISFGSLQPSQARSTQVPCIAHAKSAKSSHSHCTQNYATESEMQRRRSDALRLTSDARYLSKQAHALLDETQTKFLAEAKKDDLIDKKGDAAATRRPYDLEVRETSELNSHPPRRLVAPESKDMLSSYTELMGRYREALAAYLQHRQSVQQHAAAFHQAAQSNNNSNNPPPIITVPSLTPLAVKTQDACDALQQAEGELHLTEMQLSQAIQMMTANRKTMTGAQYAALWDLTEQKANSLQDGASAFDRNVVVKEGTNRDSMHTKMQEAMRDGDYVESQKVFGEQQRKSALLHEEVRRGTKHSQLAMQFLMQLQSLSPYAQKSNSSAASGNPDQFTQDDQMLAAEFAKVQELYKEVQAAEPKFHN